MFIPSEEYKKKKTKYFEKLGFDKIGYGCYDLSKRGIFYKDENDKIGITINLGFCFYSRELRLWCVLSGKPVIRLETIMNNNFEKGIDNFIRLCLATKTNMD